MEKITGQITAKETTAGTSVAGKAWKRASFTINEKRYSTFDEGIMNEYDSGDNVEMEFEKTSDGKYSNITNIKKVDPSEFNTADKVPEVDQSVWDQKDLRIARESCLKSAIESIKTLAAIDIEKAKSLIAESQLLDVIMDVASTFEGFVYGQNQGVNK